MSARDPLPRLSMTEQPHRRLLLAAVCGALLLLLAAGGAEARRPGGGHTFSSSHSSAGHASSSHLSSGFHSLAASSFRPGGGHTFSGGSSGRSSGGFRSGGSSSFGSVPRIGGRGLAAPPVAGPPSGPPPATDLDAIRGVDPEFSVVLFEDFAYALYAKAHESRADRRQLDALAPYLSAAARDELASRRPVGSPVSGVVIGAMRAVGLRLPDGSAPSPEARPQIGLALEFESNMTVGAGTGDATLYVRERWHLVRDAAVRSRPPEAVHSFHCPNCGAPFGPGGGDRCEYCGEVVSGGRFDWSVVVTEPLEIESRPPQLTGTVEEVGTDWPTIMHPAVGERWAELAQADPASGAEAIVARLQLIYGELNPAWTALDLAPVRGFVSDGLFDYLQYWIAAYRQQKLRNQLNGMRLTRWQIAKVVRDRHFDAVTFRIWASGRDFTVRQATGEVVGGDPNADRDYSEYWTLIRGAGVRGAPRADKNCPNCGAPLEVNMAGRCNHCDAKITSGEFDWVLSKIEQDESYAG